MANRVFLHVGAPKTGTTYLQNVLWGNRAALRRAGILLPATRKAHYQAMGDLRRGKWYAPDAWWTWDRLAAKARGWPGTVVISEEMLGAATEEQAARAIESLRPAEVHVVVAGRDLGRTIPSSWAQAIRARGLGTFGAYVEALQNGTYPDFWRNQTPLPILHRWGANVPAEHRHLVTVPPSGSDPTLLWQRFAGVLGIPEGLCELGDVASHNSLGVVETELLRRVNVAIGDEYPLRSPYMRAVHQNLVDPVLSRRENRDRFGLPTDLADWVSHRSELLVKEIREYPCEVAGDPADLIPAGLRASRSPDELDTEVLLDAAVETIVGLIGHSAQLSKELRVTKRRTLPYLAKVRVIRAKRRLGHVADRVRRFTPARSPR